MTAAVTVVISFFNNATTIADCVRSVFAQSTSDWELILLDDGSTDTSRSRISSIRDSRVRLVLEDVNAGTPLRLNQLTAMVSTPYLARMDGDDLMHPDRLARAVAALDGDPELSFVHGDAVSIDLESRPTGRRLALGEAAVAAHFRHSPFIHSTVTARTDWWAKHPYNETFRRCQDQELWVRTIGARRVRHLDGTQVYLRESGTISAAKYATSMRGTRHVLRQHGQALLGTRRTAALTALTYAKQAVYRGTEVTGSLDKVVRGRADKLSPADGAAHEAVIAGIVQTFVPGLDEPADMSP